VKAELARGAKTSHWMWFVFPQLRGLGRSATAEHYGIASEAEALAYWQHPVLGPRLKECADLMLAATGKTAREILGSPDDIKLRSSMTLFAHVAPEEPVFTEILRRFFDGERDARTLDLLRSR
jgi:uncharacterized protein (DUF1810 family)